MAADVDFAKAAEALWQIIDDIDTLDDWAKGDDRAFRSAVNAFVRRRFEYANSPDGYTLVWTAEGTPERPSVCQTWDGHEARNNLSAVLAGWLGFTLGVVGTGAAVYVLEALA